MNKFLGLKKKQEQVFNNFYLEDLKLVLKLPLIKLIENNIDIKTEEFDITKYNIFIPYE